MSTGILVCGLNGAGKSTLGRALAKALDFHFIDNENLYFQRTSDSEPYVNPRSKEAVCALLLQEVTQHPDFVFAAVRGDYGQEMLPLYQFAVLIDVPKPIRMQRIRERAYLKFGARMLPGGDLYESQEAFFAMAEQRPEDYAESWLAQISCPIIRVDGTKPIDENIALITEKIRG